MMTSRVRGKYIAVLFAVLMAGVAPGSALGMQASIEACMASACGGWDNSAKDQKVLIKVTDSAGRPATNAQIYLELSSQRGKDIFNTGSFTQTAAGVYELNLSANLKLIAHISRAMLSGRVTVPGDVPWVFQREVEVKDWQNYFNLPPEGCAFQLQRPQEEIVHVQVQGRSYSAYALLCTIGGAPEVEDAWLILDDQGRLPPDKSVYSLAAKAATASAKLAKLSPQFLRESARSYRSVSAGATVVQIAKAVRDAGSQALGAIVGAYATGGANLTQAALMKVAEKTFLATLAKKLTEGVDLNHFNPESYAILVAQINLEQGAQAAEQLAQRIEKKPPVFTEQDGEEFFNLYEQGVVLPLENMELLVEILPNTDLQSQLLKIAENFAIGTTPSSNALFYVLDRLQKVPGFVEAVIKADEINSQYLVKYQKSYLQNSDLAFNYYSTHPPLLSPTPQPQTPVNPTPATPPAGPAAKSFVLFILDTSGSMSDILAGENVTKLEGAKRELLKLLDKFAQTPGQYSFGLIIYNGCEPAVVVDFSANVAEIKPLIASLSPLEKTPIARSLELALELIRQKTGREVVNLILLSDGEETCGGDWQAAAGRIGRNINFIYDNFPSAPGRGTWVPFLPRAAYAQTPAGRKIFFSVIGFFTPNQNTEDQLKTIASLGQGDYYQVNQADALQAVFTQVMAVPNGGPRPLGPAGGGVHDVYVVLLVALLVFIVILLGLVAVLIQRRRAIR